MQFRNETEYKTFDNKVQVLAALGGDVLFSFVVIIFTNCCFTFS